MKTNVDLISTRVYAGRLKDRENLNNSSSGGAFTALSDFFLKNGNAVVAAIYNYENHTTEFQMILDKDQRERAKGSKYMQLSIRWLSEIQRNKRNPRQSVYSRHYLSWLPKPEVVERIC